MPQIKIVCLFMILVWAYFFSLKWIVLVLIKSLFYYVVCVVYPEKGIHQNAKCRAKNTCKRSFHAVSQTFRYNTQAAKHLRIETNVTQNNKQNKSPATGLQCGAYFVNMKG